MEFREANHVAAAATAVTVEESLVVIHQEAWVVIPMQRASATAQWPRRAPILRVQIAHQGNLFIQVVESFAIHGLLAYNGRIRRMAVHSQAMMVGGVEALQTVASQSLSASSCPRCSKRPAHRRTVDGFGDRDASATSPTSLQQRLVKTGGRLVKHARYYWLMLAESHLTRRLFGAMV